MEFARLRPFGLEAPRSNLWLRYTVGDALNARACRRIKGVDRRLLKRLLKADPAYQVFETGVLVKAIEHGPYV